MTELDPSGKGVFTAAGVGQNIKRITQINSMRLNPNRKFYYILNGKYIIS